MKTSEVVMKKFITIIFIALVLNVNVIAQKSKDGIHDKIDSIHATSHL